MKRSSPVQDLIAAEAADWFAQLHDAREAPEQHAEFVQWLLRSPEHLEEFLAVSRVWGETRTVDQGRFSANALIAAALAQQEPDNVVALKPAVSSKNKPLQVRKYRFAAAAACAALALGALSWMAADRWLDPLHIRTAIGEQRSVTLEDGSVLDVNTNSEIRIDFDHSQRKLQLVRGEARFKVAKNPQRPFIVSTPQASIRALGTVFNVRAESQQTAVAVLEGRVEVRELPSSANTGAVANIELKAGQQAAVSPAGRILPNAGPALERVAVWTERRLVFREEPLTEVVAEFNRYHAKPIRIEAPQLQDLRISGTFDSSDPDSLIEYFERFENVRVDKDSNGIRFSLAAH